jgi:acetylglutamate kinase
METVYVIKIGGNIIDNPIKLNSFLQQFSKFPEKKVLIHGGGKLATDLASKLNIEQKMVDGRRITDAETLKVTAMVYAGLINKNLVAGLQSRGCNAIGLSGADGNCILSKKRENATIDYGFVGDVQKVNANFLQTLLNANVIPIISPITHDGKGNLLNTNADTIATEIAIALTEFYDVNLRFSFEKLGVMTKQDDDRSWLRTINNEEYETLKNQKIIVNGMIPKLDNAFRAAASNVAKVQICHADYASEIEELFIGTQVHT